LEVEVNAPFYTWAIGVVGPIKLYGSKHGYIPCFL